MQVLADSGRVMVNVTTVGDRVAVPGVLWAAETVEKAVLGQVYANFLGERVPAEGEAPPSGLNGTGKPP